MQPAGRRTRGRMNQSITIAIDEIKQSLKNKKVLFIIAIYIALLIYGIQKSVSFSTTFRLVLIQVFGLYGQKLPYSLVLFYFISVFILPIFSLLMSYDCISKEIHKETIRNLAAAAKRSSIILGKFLGIFLINITVNMLMYLAAIIYVYQNTGIFYLAEGFLLWIFLSIYALYFIALAVMVSSLTSNPQKSLYLSLIAYLLPLLFFTSPKLAWLSPYNHYINGFYLLTDNIGKAISPLLTLALFAALFMTAALLIFRKRDL